MSLPIRQGELWKGSPPPSKKFGKALATIKYRYEQTMTLLGRPEALLADFLVSLLPRFDLAPLFISHMYSDDSEEDWSKGKGTWNPASSSTGVAR